MLEKFHYKINGKELTLPRFKDAVTFGIARRLRKLEPSEQVFELVEQLADEKALALIDTIPNDQIEAFFTAWQEDSGVTAGESSASSTS
jgi:hypothetical protein